MISIKKLSPNLKNAMLIFGQRLSSEERRMLLEIVGFAFNEGRIAGKEEYLIDCRDENEINNHEQKEEKINPSTEEDECPF